jgi:hypothetical protein
VRARFRRRPDGAYDAELWEANLAHRFSLAGVHKRVLLRFSPGMWGKELPVLAADSGLVNPADPHRATLVWRGTTPVLSIPSHDPAYRQALDSLVSANLQAIVRAPRFIIDIRGNEGGASFVTNRVAALLATADSRPALVRDGTPQMMASDDQIAYARQRWQNISSDSASVQRLIARMTAHPGMLVPITDSIDAIRESAESAAMATAVPPASPAPERVGILIDHGTVSAAEAFLLRAARSTRVRTFGEPTSGALDYQSVSIVRIGDSDRRWYLGYPTIVARADLPTGGMKGKGIAPDVRVDWRRIADPIGYVDAALRAWR